MRTMTSNVRALVGVGCWLIVGVQTSFSQSTEVAEPSARAVAVKYAIQQGLEIPKGEIAVATETSYAYPHAIASKLTPAQQLSEAREIARLLGDTARTGSARDLLPCPQFKCYCATQAAVVLVDEVSASSGVFIRIYSPAEREDSLVKLSQVIVNVEKTSKGWKANGARNPATTLHIKR